MPRASLAPLAISGLTTDAGLCHPILRRAEQSPERFIRASLPDYSFTAAELLAAELLATSYA